MFSCGLGILRYINYQTSLREYKFLIKMNLNRFKFFILLYKDDLISNQSTNQHRNVLEITIVAVKKKILNKWLLLIYFFC